MDDDKKTKRQLIEEMNNLRQRVAELQGFEEEIRQIGLEHEKFAKAFMHSSIPVAITTLKDGRFVDVSHAVLNSMGCTRDEVIGRTSAEIGFIAKKSLASFNNELNQRGRIDNFEMTVRTKNGAIRHGLFNAVMLTLNGEKYLLTVMTDITGHKGTEEALRQSESRAAAMLRAIPDLMFRMDKDGVFLDYIASKDDLYAQSIPTIIGMRNRDIAPSGFADLIDRQIRATLETGSLQTFEYDLPIPARGIHHYEARMVAAGEDEVIAIVRDVTAQKQVEEEKAKLADQTRQLKKSESLGRMAGAIAHHFNNQLSVIMGNLEMALGDLPQGAGIVENLNAAMKAAGKAAEMSSLMLTYIGQAPVKCESFDLAELCLRSLPTLRSIIPKNVTLDNQLPYPGPAVHVNTNQIRQVLANLMTNACEAMAENGGVMRLCLKTVFPADIPLQQLFPIGWQPRNHAYACLEIADTGCGIAEEDIERIFDPFFTTKFTGRGLGLAVALGIVKSHGGAVAVKSRQGRGTSVNIFLPIAEDHASCQADISSASPSIKEGGTVLLVEDEETLRNMAGNMLGRLGFLVMEAKDGMEAVEMFRQYQTDIRFVLTDLTMPRMNGWETLTALRNIAPNVPVILASGYDEAHVMAGHHPEKPQAFLGKPYRLRELGDTIHQVLVNNQDSVRK